MSGQRPLTVLGISGSLRKGSFNTSLLRAAQELVPKDMRIETFDIAPIPHYDDDVRAAGYPEPVAAFRDRIREADGVLIVSPEYNRSVPGVLKNAIDWASRAPDQPFNDKPMAFMGASRGVLGTIMCNHHLRQIFVYLNAAMVNGPEVLVGQSPTKFHESGRLTDEPTRKFVQDHLERLQDLILRMKAPAERPAR
jgi:chromate reductase, NAD(P)H dehydrogenase (quinone)